MLVARARRGDADAWLEICSRYDGTVRRVASSYRLCGADVDDVCQETWVAALRGLADLRRTASLPFWLRSIARNECLARFRSTRVVPVVEPEIGADVDVAADVIDGDVSSTVRAAIAGLDDRDRRLVDLLLERRTYGEISDLLAIPMGSIGPTRSRVFEKLRGVPALSALAAT